MFAEWMASALTNFSLSMFILATVFIMFHRSIRKTMLEGEIVYRWMALFALGATSLYCFILHAFFPFTAALTIGWVNSPFQYEVAMANLAFGVLGVLSFNASYGFRLATVIGATVMLWGDAGGHIYQALKFNNLTTGNVGTWLWMDIFTPLVLIAALRKARRY